MFVKTMHFLYSIGVVIPFQQTLNNFVSCNFFSTKLSGIDPCKKCINILGGHVWRHFIMACSKLEAMAIYVVNQACGNDSICTLKNKKA